MLLKPDYITRKLEKRTRDTRTHPLAALIIAKTLHSLSLFLLFQYFPSSLSAIILHLFLLFASNFLYHFFSLSLSLSLCTVPLSSRYCMRSLDCQARTRTCDDIETDVKWPIRFSAVFPSINFLALFHSLSQSSLFRILHYYFPCICLHYTFYIMN